MKGTRRGASKGEEASERGVWGARREEERTRLATGFLIQRQILGPSFRIMWISGPYPALGFHLYARGKASTVPSSFNYSVFLPIETHTPLRHTSHISVMHISSK